MKHIIQNGLSIDIYPHENNAKLGTIIMIPGGSGKNYEDKNGKMFTGYNDLAERFGKGGFQVYLFDARGQGLSDKKKGFSCPNAVNDLSTIVNLVSSFSETKNNNIGIWGRCGGAIIAAKYSLTYPGPIKSLAFWGCPTNISRYYQNSVIEDSVKRLEDKSIFVDKLSIHEIWDFEDMVDKINVPFFFAVGTEDSYFEPEKSANFLKSFPQSIFYNFVRLSGFGHEVDKSHPLFDYYSELYINWFSTTLNHVR